MFLNFKQLFLLFCVVIVFGFSVVFTEPQYAEGVVTVSLSNKELQQDEKIYETGVVASINNEDYYKEIKKTRAKMADKIYEYGQTFLGLEYVWGGETPEGFDCSGFLKYIYGHFGVELPRVATDQYNASEHIQPNQAEKGDLVFFYGSEEDGEQDKIVHVGMYLGGGKFLQSGGPKNNVNVSTVNIYGKSIVFGRVLK